MAHSDHRLTTILFLALCLFSSCTAATHIVLDYNSRENAVTAGNALDSIISGSSTEPFYDSWTLEGYASLLNRTLLDEAIRAATGSLSELHYQLNVPISTSTLQALEEKQPGCRLYYDIPFSYWDAFDKRVPSVQDGSEPFHLDRARQRQQILQHCTNLYSVKAHMEYGGYPNFDDMPFVFDVLTTCPSVRELDLAISHSGCVVAHYESAFDFTQNNNTFAALESLKLSGYDLDYTPTGERRYGAREFARQNTPNVLEKLASTMRLLANAIWRYGLTNGLQDFYQFMMDLNYLYGSPRTLPEPEYDNLDVWLQRMDWSRLKHLDLGYVGFDKWQRIVAAGASPESLVLRPASCCKAERDYSDLMRNLTRPLKHLKVKDVAFADYDEMIETIGSKGDSIETLALTEGEYTRHHYCTSDSSEEHCPEGRGTYYLLRPFLNTSQLHKISNQNTNITSLELDLSRIVPNIEDRSTWTLNYAALEAASSFRHLKHLKLNIESPDHYLVRAGRLNEHRGIGKLLPSQELPPFTADPSFNRTSVPALFTSINHLRNTSGLASLERLEFNVGRWSQRDQDWGMFGPPRLMIGNWVCEIFMGEEEARCYGGNDCLDEYGREGMKEPWSADWRLPDPVFKSWWEDQEEEGHSEL